MSRAELTVVIERPADDVWKVIGDMDAFSAAWGNHYKVISAGPLGVGSIIEEQEDGDTAVVTEFEPNRRMAVALPAPGHDFRHWAARGGRIGHILEPIPQGTRFVTWLEVDFKTLPGLIAPALLPLWMRRLRKPVGRVKQAIERSRPPEI